MSYKYQSHFNQIDNNIGDEGRQYIIESLQHNQTLLVLFPSKPETVSLLKRNNQILINNRNSIILNSIIITRNEQSLILFPLEIWLNIFKFIQFPSKKYGKCSSDKLFKIIFDNKSMIKQSIDEKKRINFIQTKNNNKTFSLQSR